MLNKFAAPIDYLVIGHLACDLLPDGSVTLGGTSAYAALTAQALHVKAGILTALGPEAPLEAIEQIPIAGVVGEQTTTFENIRTPEGRMQIVHHIAPYIHPYLLPEVWRSPAIVHFAPLLDEIDLNLLRLFPGTFIGVTPQGWLRSVGPHGRVSPTEWLEASYVLGRADAVVLSSEDVGGSEEAIESFVELTDTLVVTEGAGGCRLFHRGLNHQIPATLETEVDSTGAGDIFAAAFFIQYQRTGDPDLAARIAVRLASYSVRRGFLSSIPTEEEIYQTLRAHPSPTRISFAP